MHTTNNARGTVAYQAPELLSEVKSVYNNKVDIWSLGCILYELAIGAKPFSTAMNVLQHKLAGKQLEVNFDDSFEEDTRGSIAMYIHQMLQIEPFSRPSASSLLSDFINYCRPPNSTQGNYAEIHHESKATLQLDSLTAMSSTASIFFIDLSDDCYIVSESVSGLKTKEVESLNLPSDHTALSNFTSPTALAQEQRSQGISDCLNPTLQGSDQNAF